MGRTIVRVAMSSVLGIGISSTFVGAAHGDDPTVETIWVSPQGNDSGDGTQTNPVRSLGAANDILCAKTPDCSGLGRPVDIRIRPGVYTDASTVWTYHDDSHRTRFVPAGWQPGWTYKDVIDHGGYPTFDGGLTRTWGFMAVHDGDRSNISWYYIKWRRYARGGISQKGGGGDLVYGNVFSKIGSYYTRKIDVWGYGGVLLKNVTGSTIKNNHFVDILNTIEGGGYSHEHSVYLLHSSHNQVLGNQFVNNGGDPVRVRNGANYNTVDGNTFTRAGQLGYIGDWQCRIARHPDCPDGDEVRSWHNTFKNNTLNGPHPWHNKRFKARFCYDLNTWCTSQRIAG